MDYPADLSTWLDPALPTQPVGGWDDTRSSDDIDFSAFLSPHGNVIPNEELLRSIGTAGPIDSEDLASADLTLSPPAQDLDPPIDCIDEFTTLGARSGVATDRDMPSSAKTRGKKKSQRTTISKEAKEVLEAIFRVEPYPSNEELEYLVSKTGLTFQTVRTWFGNARSRKKGFEYNPSSWQLGSSGGAFQDSEQPRQISLSGSDIPVVQSDAPDRSSPALSASPMERYLSTPIEDDAISVPALRSLSASAMSNVTSDSYVQASSIPTGPTSSVTGPGDPYLRTSQGFYSPRHASSVPERAVSTLDSMSSVGSARSMRSRASQLSGDPRGSRRGRKKLRRLQTPAHKGPNDEERETQVEGNLLGIGKQFQQSQQSCYSSPRSPPRPGSILAAPTQTAFLPLNQMAINKPEKATQNRIFCTWPTCDRTFQYRSEWARHEEALHYCPYHWICCFEDAAGQFDTRCFICGERFIMPHHLVHYHKWDCAGKPLAQRTFLREDQAIQHIKRMHLKPAGVQSAVPKDVLAKWKTPNPNFNVTALYCGFCGARFGTWAHRQEHVFQHIQHGLLKSDWSWGRTSL